MADVISWLMRNIYWVFIQFDLCPIILFFRRNQKFCAKKKKNLTYGYTFAGDQVKPKEKGRMLSHVLLHLCNKWVIQRANRFPEF